MTNNKSKITETCLRIFHKLLDTTDNSRGSCENRLYDNILYSLHEQFRVLSH